jgi:hypothetical protein
MDMTNYRRNSGRASVVCALLLLTACFDEKATDSSAATADPSQTVAITLNGTPPAEITEGDSYFFQPGVAPGSASGVVTFSVTGQPQWALFDTSTGTLTGIPTSAYIGDSADIVIQVTSSARSGAIGPFRIKVKRRNTTPPPANAAPVISGSPATSVVVGQSYVFTPKVVDTDSSAFTYSVINAPSWATFSTANGTLAGIPNSSQVGTYASIVISVSDGTTNVALPAFSILVSAANRAPTIAGSPAASVVAGQLYSFTPTASDADGNPLTFSIVGKPAWASFNTSTGRLSGTPGTGSAGNYGNITVSVSDGSAVASLPAFSIQVTTVTPANTAPTITGVPAGSVNAGSSYSFVPVANDADGNTLSFSIQNKPAWATFSAATGGLSGVPTAANVGTYSNIAISVSDGKATTALPAFSIQVKSVNRAPTISGTPPAAVMTGQAYDFAPSAADADGNPLTFTIQNRPSWATFNAATGRLSGTPSATGNFANIVISVSDGTASASLAPFTIVVTATPVASATLSWITPTQNTDGSTLTNLAGFRIYSGTSANTLSQLVDISSTSVTSYVVNNLSQGTWYFAVKSYNVAGAESDLSSLVSKTVQATP